MKNSPNSRSEEQDFVAMIKTVSWRTFQLTAEDEQTAHKKGGEIWNDYLPNHEYIVSLEIIPDV